ncbi:efflux RND transporter periplasmic adaptor subunit, partial [Singulisphaera rosea]
RVISKGLESGVPVIVDGLQLIRPGIAVKTEPAVLPQRITDRFKASEGQVTDRAIPGQATSPKS